MKYLTTLTCLVLTISKLQNISAEVNCVKCEDCPEEITDVYESEPCESSCAIYKNDGLVVRGCYTGEVTPLDTPCTEEHCNKARVPVCEKCSILDDCTTVACDALDDDCYVGKLDESRGCTSDDIYGGTPENFDVCSTDSCNRIVECVICNSANGEQSDCLENPNKYLTPCKNHGLPKENNCYRCQESSVSFQLGCTSADDKDSSSYCTDCCKECESDNCNSKEFLTCYACPDCSHSMDEVSETFRCQDYDTECYIAYDVTTQITSRDCTDGLTSDRLGDIVMTCPQSMCNSAEFPTHLQCHQDGIDRSEYCLSVESAKCYTLEDAEGGLHYGCDLDEGFNDCSEFSNCLVCSSDGCNTPVDHENIHLECITCRDTEDCINAACEEAKFYDGCFTYISGSTVEKGCLNALTNDGSSSEVYLACNIEASKDDPPCYKCTESNCNAVHCLTCDSEFNDACVEGNAETISYEVCPPEDTCVMFVENGYTKRGCSSSFEETVSGSTGPGENVGLIPENAYKCYQCENDCEHIDESQLKYCSRNHVLGCFYKFNGESITSRGCLSELDTKCEDDLECFECDESKCNSATSFECFECTFQDGENDCVGNLNPSTCKTTESCVIYVRDDSFVRGCVSEESLPSCSKVCDTNLCNDNDVCGATSDCNGLCSDVQSNEKCVRYQNEGEVRLGCNEYKNEICGSDAEHCYTCDANFCNTKELAECFTCTQQCSTTDLYATKLCENIDDECYTARNVNGEVVRGCAGDVDIDSLSDYQPCSNPACNKEPVYSCYRCLGCDTVGTLTPEACDLPTFEGCYTVQNMDDLTVDRGCVGDSNYETCLADVNCITCEDKEACNTDTIRTEPLWCSSCQSAAECSEYTPPEQCKDGMLVDQCVEYEVFSSLVFRGCLSEGISLEIVSDCYGPRTSCTLCNNNYCNTPDLTCYKCSSEEEIECITNPADIGVSETCIGLAHCYTEVTVNGHLNRGCSAGQIDDDMEGPLKKSCQSHMCNSDIIPTDRLHCYQCKDLNCLVPTEPKPCPVYESDQQCYTYAETETAVYRGCTDDEWRLFYSDKPCKLCRENNCNIHPAVVPNTLSCIQCTSNSDCDGKAFGQTCTKQLLLERNDLCYTQYFTGLPIEKGCLSDLSTLHPYYEACQENNDDCETCPEDDCNKGEALCYVCDSEKNVDCSELSTNEYTSECDGKCVTLVNDYTKRDCIENFSSLNEVDCESSSLCEICQDRLCNNKMLPADRTQCYVCQGSDCVSPSPAKLKACSRYREIDQCYTLVVNASWVERDCLSSVEGELCGDYCEACLGKGCNIHGIMETNSLSCVQCKGDECIDKVEGSKCSSMVLLGRQDQCYTYQDEETIQKGCLSDLEDEDYIRENCTNGNDGLCLLCSTNDCNGDLHYCITCDSEEDRECGGRMFEIPEDKMELCDGRKCVSYIDADDNTHKGCYDEAIDYGEEFALFAECTESMCNNVVFPDKRILCHQCDKSEYCQETPSGQPIVCSKYDSNDSCYVKIEDGTLSRGCLSDEQADCADDACDIICSSNGCNDHPYEYDSSLSCIDCAGARQCETATEPVACKGSVILGQSDACYSQQVNGEVIRKGCARELQSDCSTSQCTICNCNNCNLIATSSKTLTCIVCTGEGCVNELMEEGTCDKACISYVSKEGVVSRGCWETFETICSDYGTEHETCFEDNCNKDIFPKDRILCHRCEDCAEDIGSPEICPIYVKEDQCYIAISDDSTTVSRGCQSELLTNCVGLSCTLCDTSGCNDRNPLESNTTDIPEVTTDPVNTPTDSSNTPTDPINTPTDPINTPTDTPNTPTEQGSTPTDIGSTPTVPEPSTPACIRCNESIDVSCGWGYQTNATEQCPSEDETGCFTCWSDSFVIRGCASEAPQSSCTAEPGSCSGSGCNNENVRVQQCAVCTSSGSCSSSYPVQTCDGIVEYAHRGCYLLRNERRIIVERGCVASLSDSSRVVCESSSDACTLCYADGCNSGMTTRILNGLIATIAAFGLIRYMIF
ncbi:uncharacterized protein LOC134213029 isoform X2 [Armigeres subalbatus]|uniref:uncharacterized protein LOC134213029 isoform X2 n=1 Tax=Armigeres subalbatus TaxID=124917 RepID=UPI002ED6480B